MEFACSVEVQDGVKGSRVAVKEELILYDGVVAAEGEDVVVGVRPRQHPEARGRHHGEQLPQDLGVPSLLLSPHGAPRQH